MTRVRVLCTRFADSVAYDVLGWESGDKELHSGQGPVRLEFWRGRDAGRRDLGRGIVVDEREFHRFIISMVEERREMNVKSEMRLMPRDRFRGRARYRF